MHSSKASFEQSFLPSLHVAERHPAQRETLLLLESWPGGRGERNREKHTGKPRICIRIHPAPFLQNPERVKFAWNSGGEMRDVRLPSSLIRGRFPPLPVESVQRWRSQGWGNIFSEKKTDLISSQGLRNGAAHPTPLLFLGVQEHFPFFFFFLS